VSQLISISVPMEDAKYRAVSGLNVAINAL
jgi:hypothetical protein